MSANTIESVKIENLLGMLTVKLQDDNFVKWNFQFQSVLRGYDLLDFFTGDNPCPPKYVIHTENGVTKEITTAYKTWVKQDMALLSLLIATLSDDAMEHVIGCKTSHEAWSALQDRYASVSVSRINQLKTEFHTAQKGGDSIDKFLLKLKAIRDQLISAGERVSDNDLVIAVLTGLPQEFDMIRTVILARETPISLKDFRAQLLSAELTIDSRVSVLTGSMAAMYMDGGNGKGHSGSYQANGTYHGESSAMGASGYQGGESSTIGTTDYQGGYGFTGSNQRIFPSQNRGSFNNTRNSYGNNASKPYFGNKNKGSNSSFSDSGRNSQSSFNGQSSNGGSKGSSNWQNWNGNTTYRSSITPECQICSRRGHTAPNCHFRSTTPANQYPILVCQICGKKGHTALECFHRNNYAYQGAPPPPTLTALSAQGPSSFSPPSTESHPHGFSAADTWVLDTGATHHMTANLNNLSQATAYTGDEKIIIGNGQGLDVKHIGSTNLFTPVHCLFLKNVLHVPYITVNLLSVKQLCHDNDCWFICDDTVFFIQDKATNVVIYQGRSDGELFTIPVTVFSRSGSVNKGTQGVKAGFVGKMIKTAIWHKRLGHPSEEILTAMLKAAKVPVSLDSSQMLCTSCISSKMCRQSFPVKQSSVTFLFERVHSDVWGPSPKVSIEGYRYYISFIDEFSRFLWIFPLVNKSEAVSAFIKFHAFVSNQFNTAIKCLQTDGGGEYMSKVFGDFLESKGIVHRISCPYTPQQNGISERKHRHLVETALTLMSEANLSPSFWYHACSYASFLINRMPSKVLQMKSPYQLLFDKVPDIHNLKVFGTAVYPFLRPYNANKLQARSAQCVFLGYALGYKGVVCYNVETRKMILSRHVIHDESVFPYTILHSTKVSDSSKTSSITQRPIVVQIPIATVLEDQNTPRTNNGEAVQDMSLSISDHGAHSADRSGSLNEVSGSESLSLSQGISSLPDSSLITPSSIGIPQMLPVHNDTQLEVILPFSSPISSNLGESNNASVHPMVTRLKSGTIPQRSYKGYLATFPELQSLQLAEDTYFGGGFSFLAVHSDDAEPSTFRKAATMPQWQSAMQDEYDSLRAQGTWELVPPPSDRTIIGSKWVYKIKKNPDGTVSRYKARLVAQGFSQEQGVDYSETFSPVVRHTTVRIVIALAAINHWDLRQLDIKNAFLHGELQEDIYMKQPQGFVDVTKPTHVCKLIKSLYGLKQAPRAWNSKFTSYLPAMGFKASTSDSSLFVKQCEKDMVILLLYVDDIIITGSNSSTVQRIITELSEVFELKDMGRLTYFLGLQITYKSNGDIGVNQSKYVKDLLHKAGMDSCKPASTPCKPHTPLLLNEGDPLSDPTLYRSIVGSLQYLTFTRPDIAYAVNTVCQFMAKPTEVHFGAVKRILRFLKGTMHHGITFSAHTEVGIHAFSDADWAADLNTRRSVTGYVVYIGCNPVSWQSKKQDSVSRSSTEAEYKALAHTAADIAWIRSVLKDMAVILNSAPVIYCDNKSAIAISANPVFHSRIKHLDTDYHFVREKVQQGDLQVHYLSTEDQTADILTKGLHSPLFLKHSFNLKLGNPVEIEGGC
ncbi:hypothetical protein ACFX15_011235 [Malus domestica]